MAKVLLEKTNSFGFCNEDAFNTNKIKEILN